MMNTDELVFAVIDHLNEHQLPYMLVGSLATNFYCVPRSTQDGDIVIDSSPAQVARQLTAKYPSIYFDPQLAFESVTATRKIVLQSSELEFEIELFQLGADEHDQERFSRRVQVNTMDRLVWIASLEDMIITKLRWSQHIGREKDVADARNLVGVQSDRIDWPYVESWCDRHGTRELLERLRNESASE
jgi:hypothetical protein